MDYKDLWDLYLILHSVLDKKYDIKLANSLSQQYCETSLDRLMGQGLRKFIGQNSAVFEVLEKNS